MNLKNAKRFVPTYPLHANWIIVLALSFVIVGCTQRQNFALESDDSTTNKNSVPTANSSMIDLYDPPPIPLPTVDGNRVNPSSEYAKKWPGKSFVFRMNDELIVAVPPQHIKFWNIKPEAYVEGNKRGTVAPIRLSKTPLVPDEGGFGFEFWLPDMSGYTPENYLNEIDKRRVKVFFVRRNTQGEQEKIATETFGQSNFNIRTSLGLINPDQYEMVAGLRCYKPSESYPESECLSMAINGTFEEISIRKTEDSAGLPYPAIRAKYASKRYGGIHVDWQTSRENIQNWREIDIAVWQFIERWNLVK